MNLLQLLLILRARYKVALVIMLSTVMIALAISLWFPKQYTATAAVLVDIRYADPIAAMIVPSSLATQVDVIASDRVSRKVVKILKLDERPELKDQWLRATDGTGTPEIWLAKVVQGGLGIKPSPQSNIISISYRAADPKFAAAAANAFAQAYIDTSIELRVQPAREYARWFGEQGKLLRENVEKAQARLSVYQQEKGIVARDEQLDTEMAKFRELSSQLTVIEAQTADARSKQNAGAESLPEVMQSSVIAALKSDIGRLEAKLQEIAVNLGDNHPQYQRMQSELAALKQRLDKEMRYITRGFSATGTVSKNKEAELRAAIEAQKRKLLMLRNERDQLAVLQRDVDAAKSAYDAVTSRYNQTSLASQATQTNVSVLNPAVEPITPSFPKPLPINLLISILAGSLLGAGMAYVLELRDRRIRSAKDLGEMLQVPVLGIIGPGRSHRRLAVGYQKPALIAR